MQSEHPNFTTFNAAGSRPESGSEPDERVMPLGVGGFESDGAAGESDALPSRRFGSGTILLIALVLLAAGGLYSMRSIARAVASSKSGDAGIEKTIESFLNSIAGKDERNADRVLVGSAEAGAGDVLVDNRTDRQVPLDGVQKNPFVLPVEDKPATTSSAPKPPTDNAAAEAARLETARQDARVAFEKASAKLMVKMIMRDMANVSGRVVRVGDIIADAKSDIEFTVVEITRDAVVIRGEKPEIGLTHDITLRLLKLD